MKWLPTGSEAIAADDYTQMEIGIPGIVLMERAGEALFRTFLKMVRGEIPTAGKNTLSRFRKERDRILIAVESGNNGGDGLVFARWLSEEGFMVDVLKVNGISHKTKSFQTEEKILSHYPVRQYDLENFDMREAEAENRYTVAVDAIFGVGLSRPVEGPQGEAVGFMNRIDAFRLAVDIPTGLSADTGEYLGDVFRADATITFEFPKLGMYTQKYKYINQKSCCGTILVEKIGLHMPKDLTKNMVHTEDRVKRERLPYRPEHAHKGFMGKTLIIAGSKDMAGAAILAGKAALASGVGLVRILTERSNRTAVLTALPEVICDVYDHLPEEPEEGMGAEEKERRRLRLEKVMKKAAAWAHSIAVGPGIGTGETGRAIMHILKDSIGLVTTRFVPHIFDADAITILAEEPQLMEAFQKGPLYSFLTPHVGEMKRLLKTWPDPEGKTPEEDPVGVARRFIKDLDYGREMILVLKSHQTVVARKDWTYLSTHGNPGMATGGSGDVLTGLLAGLAAPAPHNFSRDWMAETAVLIHSLAGDMAAERKGRTSMTAGDIADCIPEVLRQAEGLQE